MLPFAGRAPSVLPVDVDGLRVDYQEPAVVAALEAAQASQRMGVIKLFTGAGKTRTAIALIRRWLAAGEGRCLWVANRTVLIEDAISRLAKSLGMFISREQAASRASATRVVVGSMATLKGARLEAFQPDEFGLIIVDECQYLRSAGNQAIIDHFPNACVIGLSATPGGIGPVIFERDLLWAIDEGYAVPLVAKYERLLELDISDIKSGKTALGTKDLQIGALEEVVLKAAAPIARAVWQHGKDRHPIVYTPGVASAHAVAKMLNEYKPGFAESVDAKTPPEERRKIQAAFDSGELRCLVNCAIYLFGFDAPTCDMIAIARLTEDWGLYMQQLGRGVRTAPGIGEMATREERLAAIAVSRKPNMLLLDLSGQHGKHAICSPTDIDPSLEKDVRARATKALKDDPERTVTDAIKEAKAWKRGEYDRLARLAAQAKITTESGTFDPFRSAGIGPGYKEHAPAWAREPATEPQKWLLRKNGLPDGVTKGEAGKLIGQMKEWEKTGRATHSQRQRLSRAGLPHDLPWSQAAALLSACTTSWVNGSRVDRSPAREVVERILMESSSNLKQGGV